MVEYKLPKLGVAGSNPVARSIKQTTESRIQTTAPDAVRKNIFSLKFASVLRLSEEIDPS